MNSYKVFLADDHHIVREGMLLLLQSTAFEVIGEAADGEEALSQIRELKPDIALLDLNMPKLDGIEVTRMIKESDPDIKVIILTVYMEEKFLKEAIQCGADGYASKVIRKHELISGMESVVRGERFIDPKLLQQSFMNSLEKKGDKESALTDRELEVLKLVAQGKTNREISVELFLGSDTTKEYVGNVIRKLDCKNRTEAVAKAIRNHIIV
ncbi:response regulator [Cohnella terricola]|uniref:Response regulator transcription factor n=1 Tax=Cohnella terricola TaxID=1289167 RepID=A0A559JWG3_9BACL|nr:response regulator transcription factor [Cohnella terricola]TVY04232.1 response regulator transcription factor [Cohnella terricola]